MRFTFLSLFPNIINDYFKYSILKRAIDNGLIKIDSKDLRKFGKDNRVDSYQIGGGAGVVISSEVIINAISSLNIRNSHIIYLTPCAKLFNFKDAKRISNYEHVTFICGRYEGIDERVVEKVVDEVFSIGNYIITGGELASLILCDCISRYIPNVLGNESSLIEESFEKNILEAPVFTKKLSESGIENSNYPSEYSKGNHIRISALKRELSLRKTKYFRPDMLEDNLI